MPAKRQDQCNELRLTACNKGLPWLNGENGLMSGCIKLSKATWEYTPRAAPMPTWEGVSDFHRKAFGRNATERATKKRATVATATAVAPTKVWNNR